MNFSARATQLRAGVVPFFPAATGAEPTPPPAETRRSGKKGDYIIPKNHIPQPKNSQSARKTACKNFLARAALARVAKAPLARAARALYIVVMVFQSVGSKNPKIQMPVFGAFSPKCGKQLRHTTISYIGTKCDPRNLFRHQNLPGGCGHLPRQSLSGY